MKRYPQDHSAACAPKPVEREEREQDGRAFLENTEREVVLLDCDAFYSQCEELRLGLSGNEPLAVTQKHIVVTCNYPARSHGLKKLQLVDDARSACPHAYFISGEDLSSYRSTSKAVLSSLRSFGCSVEKAGLEEMYVDVSPEVSRRSARGDDPPFHGYVHCASTQLLAHNPNRRPMDLNAASQGNQQSTQMQYAHLRRLRIASAIAKEMRDHVHSQCGIRTSAGIAHNKLCAKLCLVHKPGQTTLPPTEAAAFVATLPARVIPGVGSKVDKMLSHHFIEYIRDLRQFSHAQLEPIIGGNTALASYLSEACWGKDETPVREKGLPSKVSVEDSFKVCDSIEAARCIIRKLAPDLIARLKEDVWEENRKARTLRLSWRDANNESSTRRHAASTNLPQEVHCNSDVQSAADSVIQKAVSLLQRNLPTSGFNLKLLNIAAVNISQHYGPSAFLDHVVERNGRNSKPMVSHRSSEQSDRHQGRLSKSGERHQREKRDDVAPTGSIDIVSFYVSVERADDPSLNGKPVVVEQFNSGGFVALSHEARACGLRPGDGAGYRGRHEIESLREMQSVSKAEAKQKCPELVILPMRPDRYREASKAIKSVLDSLPGVQSCMQSSYDDFYLSFDEMHLSQAADHSSMPGHATIIDDERCGHFTIQLRSALCIVQRCIDAISSQLSFPAVGTVATGKLFARLASARPEAKESRLAIVPFGAEAPLARNASLQRIPGLQGKLGKHVCHIFGVSRLKDVEQWSEADMRSHFGAKMAIFLRNAMRGLDPSQIEDRGLPMTLTAERSFTPLQTIQKVTGAIQPLCETLITRLLDDVKYNSRLPAKLEVQFRQGYNKSGKRMRSQSQTFPQDVIFVLWRIKTSPSHTDNEQEAKRSASSIKDAAMSMLRNALLNEHWNVTRLTLAASYTQHKQAISWEADHYAQTRISSFVGKKRKASKDESEWTPTRLSQLCVVNDECLRTASFMTKLKLGGWCTQCSQFRTLDEAHEHQR